MVSDRSFLHTDLFAWYPTEAESFVDSVALRPNSCLSANLRMPSQRHGRLGNDTTMLYDIFFEMTTQTSSNGRQSYQFLMKASKRISRQEACAMQCYVLMQPCAHHWGFGWRWSSDSLSHVSTGHIRREWLSYMARGRCNAGDVRWRLAVVYLTRKAVKREDACLAEDLANFLPPPTNALV